MIWIKEMDNKTLPKHINNSFMTNAGRIVLGMIGTTAATANYTMNPTESAGLVLATALGLTVSAMVITANDYENKTK